jgi:hypothetical protein
MDADSPPFTFLWFRFTRSRNSCRRHFVLDAKADALLDVAVPDDLVHDDTNGGGRHVVDRDDARAAESIWLAKPGAV